MPRPLNDMKQPQLGSTAADLGQEAYDANLCDEPGHETAAANPAGTVPAWKRPEPRNAPPGQHPTGGPEIRMGRKPEDT